MAYDIFLQMDELQINTGQNQVSQTSQCSKEKWLGEVPQTTENSVEIKNETLPPISEADVSINV